jgi:hypothetical protein
VRGWRWPHASTGRLWIALDTQTTALRTIASGSPTPRPKARPMTSPPSLRPVPMPVDVNDRARFPNIAAARDWLAGLSPERRAELQEGFRG